VADAQRITIDAHLALEGIEKLRGKIDRERSKLVRELLAEQLKAVTDQFNSGPKGGGNLPLGVRTNRLRGSFTSPPVSAIGKAGDEMIGVETGSNLEYAAIHEFGGEIVPIHAKFLAIPVGRALTPKGVERGSAKLDKDSRQLDVIFWKHPKNPNIVGALGIDSQKAVADVDKNRKLQTAFAASPIAQAGHRKEKWYKAAKRRVAESAKNRKLRAAFAASGSSNVAAVSQFEAFYLLAKKVTIKPTHYLSRAFNASEKEIRRIAEARIQEWIMAAGGGGNA
jgi:hypothetical protein